MIGSVVFSGLGAVGAIYAELAAQCAAADCFAVVRDVASYAERPVSVNGRRLCLPLRQAGAGGAPVDLAIVAVKWYDLEDALDQLEPFVGEGTTVLALLNGICAERAVADRFPRAHVLLSMCSGVDSNREGRAVRMNRRGRIVFGEEDGRMTPAVRDVAAYFSAAGIPYETPPDMLRRLWWKLMVNVGMNQVSAVTGQRYGAFRSSPETMAHMHRAQREVVAVANALGIPLGEEDIEQWDRQLAGLSSDGLSSTLQDLLARRRTEVELYGGEICRLGARLGVPTPENEALVRRIHELEAAYLK